MMFYYIRVQESSFSENPATQRLKKLWVISAALRFSATSDLALLRRSMQSHPNSICVFLGINVSHEYS